LKPEYKERFDKLVNRRVLFSHFIDIEITQSLGIYDEVKMLYENIDIWEFKSTIVPTYKTLIYEFLSSFEHSDDCELIQFQLDGVKHIKGFKH
jgi:hypothetical protein